MAEVQENGFSQRGRRKQKLVSERELTLSVRVSDISGTSVVGVCQHKQRQDDNRHTIRKRGILKCLC